MVNNPLRPYAGYKFFLTTYKGGVKEMFDPKANHFYENMREQGYSVCFEHNSPEGYTVLWAQPDFSAQVWHRT